MKKAIIIFILLISFLSSCKKATKVKVVNFWKVESYEMVKIENVPGGSNFTTMNIKDSKYKSTEDLFDKDDTIEDGNVRYFLFTIKKDGTWTIEKDLVYKKTFAYKYSKMG
jgi:major membrane immunogen (membrane-anchored lipoprotein)